MVAKVRFRGGSEVLGEDVGMIAFPAARAPGDSGSVLEGRPLRHWGQENI